MNIKAAVEAAMVTASVSTFDHVNRICTNYIRTAQEFAEKAQGAGQDHLYTIWMEKADAVQHIADILRTVRGSLSEEPQLGSEGKAEHDPERG